MRSVALPVAIYAASRLISAVFLSIGGGHQAALTNHWRHFVWETVPASPGYWGVLANWDGQWYKAVALDGYPADLPMADGRVVANAWAFYPLFPTLSRLVMRLTGLPFEVAGGLLNLLAGGVAVVLLYAMLRRRMSVFASAATISALCAFPTAAVLQAAYSESITLLVLVLALWALHARTYGIFIGLVVVLSLARPIAPPLMLVAAAHWLGRWRLEGLPRSPSGWFTPVGTVAITGASTLLWPAVAWLSTGDRQAFFASQEAWRQSRSHDSFVSASLLGQALGSPLLLALAAALLSLFLFLAFRSPSHRWGLELRAWVAIYPVYILLATQPTMSVVRYLMLAMVPWWPFPEAGEQHDEPGRPGLVHWLILACALALELVLQYAWVTRVFTIDVGPDYQGFP